MIYIKAQLLVVDAVVLSLVMGWIYERTACRLPIELLPPSCHLFLLERVTITHYDHTTWPLWRQIGYTALLTLLELCAAPFVFVLGFLEFGIRLALKRLARIRSAA